MQKKLEICFLNIKFIALYTYSRDIRAENLTSKYVIGLKSCNVEAPYSTQWGSEIRTSLDLEWSKRGWVANSPDLEWDPEAQPFDIRTNGCHFVPNHLKSGVTVQILNGL